MHCDCLNQLARSLWERTDLDGAGSISIMRGNNQEQ
jgi:hypothetical protein